LGAKNVRLCGMVLKKNDETKFNLVFVKLLTISLGVIPKAILVQLARSLASEPKLSHQYASISILSGISVRYHATNIKVVVRNRFALRQD